MTIKYWKYINYNNVVQYWQTGNGYLGNIFSVLKWLFYLLALFWWYNMILSYYRITTTYIWSAVSLKMPHRTEQKKTDVSQYRCEIGCQKCLFFSLHDPIWTKIRIISNTSGKFHYRTQRMWEKFFNEREKVTKDVFFSRWESNCFVSSNILIIYVL